MTYGVQAFSLIFSVVGTILGGIWANESWGRFWGWDPKENGALLICLSQIALFHGRMGGYLRATGFAIASIFTGCVVVFSWWGVNLLGVGLHSYGFTSGLWMWIIYFWGFQAMVMIAGMLHDSAMKSAAAETA
jgi:ABC-type transport system involved in cytochrome c biogenesis permease subunit